MQPGNAINWFEIPVSDFERAKKFYESIFSYKMPVNNTGSAKMGFFLYDFESGNVGGAIVENPSMFTPSDTGTLVFLNCQPDLQIVLDKVEAAGGRIVNPKTIISPDQNHGYWALITDSEGNKVALHPMG